jgi:hypothetical protein
VGGFVAGAGLAGLLETIAVVSTSFASPNFLFASWLLFLSAFWLPPIAGLTALLWKGKPSA